MERDQKIRLYLMSKLRICKAKQRNVSEPMRASQLRQNINLQTTNVNYS